jgi:hypothetical protein
MPTLTIQYRHSAERLVLEQALAIHPAAPAPARGSGDGRGFRVDRPPRRRYIFSRASQARLLPNSMCLQGTHWKDLAKDGRQ